MSYQPDENSGRSDSPESVGDEGHRVQQGECMNTIAKAHGFTWQAVWNHAKNEELRAARKDHNALLPGDRVFIPDKREKQENRGTEQHHRFRRKGVPSYITIRLLEDESPEPYANQPYQLDVDGKLTEGTIDDDGYVDLPIPPQARSIILFVGEGENRETFDLSVSTLDPINTPTGAQQRLQNLGYFEGTPGETWDDAAAEALRQIKATHVVEGEDEAPSGVYDERTQQKLKEIHAS